MTEETLSFSLLGLTGYAYGLLIALGAACMLVFFARYCKAEGLKSGTAPLFAALSVPLGLICGRLLFCLLDFRFRSMFSLRGTLMFWGGGFSMAGALLGAALAAWLTARIQRIAPIRVLDVAAASVPFFIARARMAEMGTELLGRSRPLTTAWLAGSFLAQSDGYDAYLRTYLLEAVTAGALGIGLAVRFRKKKTHKGSLLLCMLILGCTQVFWESLRFDSHMRYSFISMQQILFALMFAASLVIYAARCGKKEVITAVCVCIALVAAIVGLEFMIDRSSVNNLILYIPYALLLAVPVWLGLRYKKRSEQH